MEGQDHMRATSLSKGDLFVMTAGMMLTQEWCAGFFSVLIDIKHQLDLSFNNARVRKALHQYVEIGEA